MFFSSSSVSNYSQAISVILSLCSLLKLDVAKLDVAKLDVVKLRHQNISLLS